MLLKGRAGGQDAAGGPGRSFSREKAKSKARRVRTGFVTWSLKSACIGLEGKTAGARAEGLTLETGAISPALTHYFSAADFGFHAKLPTSAF